MENLTTCTSDKISALLETSGAFFAFSQDQFDAKAVNGIEYVSLSNGMIAPKPNVGVLVDGLSRICREEREKDLAEIGKEAIIRRELINYECFYTGDTSECEEALTVYGITKEEVASLFKHIRALGERDD
jgi:hypothetical protein